MSRQAYHPLHPKYAQPPFEQNGIFAWAMVLKCGDFHLDRTANLKGMLCFHAAHKKWPAHFRTDPDFR